MKAQFKMQNVNNATLRTLNLTLAMLLAMPAFGATASPRKPVDPRGMFAKLTGQISQVGQPAGFGNGFVVGAEGCHVLTNFHVAFGKSSNPQTGETEMVDTVEVGHTVNFAFDADSKTGNLKRTFKAKVVEFGNYEFGTSRGFTGDIALLRLETCLGKEYGHLEFDRPPVDKKVPTGRLMTVSSARNAANKNEVLVEEGCRAASTTAVSGMMLANCENVAGMSGSMILEEGQDKKWRLAGISTMRSTYADGTPVSKAIYAKVINQFIDSALGGG